MATGSPTPEDRETGTGAPKFSDTQLRAIATVVCGVLAETQATGRVPLGGEGSATSSSGASPTGEWQLDSRGVRKVAAAVAARARMGRGRKRSPRSLPPANSRIGVPPALGTRPSGESIRRLSLATTEELAVPGGTSSATEGSPFAFLIPWLTSLSTAGSPSDPADSKPTRYLTAKGLPTLRM